MTIKGGIKRLKRGLKNFNSYVQNGGVVYCEVKELVWEHNVLAGKTALITGGSSGIGYEIANKYVKMGANVIITGRNEEKLKEACQSIGEGVKYIVWDISCIIEAESKMKQAFELFGDIDILVNNAGIYEGSEIFENNENLYNIVMDTNVKGTYFITQAYAKIVKEKCLKNIRKIIFILSIRSWGASTNNYELSKKMELAVMEGAVKKLYTDEIIVNGIAPGPTTSNINKRDAEGNIYNGGGKIGRFLIPQEIANVACFLASDAANAIVGQVIAVDGGEIL